MNSRWWAEVLAILGKEWCTERRAKHALLTSSLFSVLSVIAMAFASAEQRPTPTLYAGMFTVVLLFAATITLPRVFLAEDEQGTMDLLRLLSRPEAAFWGKFFFALLQVAVTAAVLATLFVGLSGVEVRDPGIFVVGLAMESFTLAATISVTGVLVVGASNRWLLGAVVALPLLLPQVTLSIGVLRFAFGEGAREAATQNLGGLALFALGILSFGPILAHYMWRLDSAAPGDS